MKKSKITFRLLMVAVAVCLLTLVAIPASHAYFTAKDDANTTYTFAKMDTEIEEPKPEIQTDYIIKTPSVKNSGEVGCMVRVRLDATPSQLFENGILELDINTTSWIKSGDWYYYNRVLETKETSESILNGIKMLDKEKITTDFDVAVTQESIQYEISNQGTYLNAKNEDGSIKQDVAKKIWQIYENRK